jgi:outer membrane murein-binding lipoprotein Lpp
MAAAAAVTLAGCSSFPASEPKQPEEHKAHHPAAESATAVDPAKFNQQMKAMHDMHQKMMAAKTPAERAALMKDHMRTMQDGMVMMGQMSGGPMMGQKGSGMSMQGGGMSSTPGGPSMQKDMMQRMDMMEMMMQMMVDREAAMPPAVK